MLSKGELILELTCTKMEFKNLFERWNVFLKWKAGGGAFLDQVMAS
jgi:hypothetical protein